MRGAKVVDKVRFFGITGDKKLMFNNELTPGSGLFLQIDGKKIIMDPGPGTFCAFNRLYPNMVKQLDAVILSHVHFDHSTDVNVMIEGMTDGGNKKRGKLITLEFAYEGESKVIYNYLKSFPQETCLVDCSPITMLGAVKVEAIEHQHGIPNYGYKFSYDKTCVSIITDTRYFPELSERYMGSTTMIVNVPYYDFPEGKHPKHLNISDVKDILVKVKPRKVFLTHFGENIFQHDVYGIAASLERELGIEVNVAETGKEFELI